MGFSTVPALAGSVRNPIETGVVAGAQVFTAGTTTHAVESFLSFGMRAGYALHSRFSVEGEISLTPARANEIGSELDGATDFLAVSYRAHAVLNLTTGALFRPFVAVGGGAVTSARTEPYTEDSELKVPLKSSDTDPVINGGVGFKFLPTDWLGVRMEGRALYVPTVEDEIGTARYEFLVGVYGRFGGGGPPPAKQEVEKLPEDADGDGVPLIDDWCPSEKEDLDGFHDDDGCPDVDNDDDKVADTSDKCPDQAESENGVDDDDGCPERDNDEDGLLGSQDKCPDEAPKDGVDQDKDGCTDPPATAEAASEDKPQGGETAGTGEEESGGKSAGEAARVSTEEARQAEPTREGEAGKLSPQLQRLVKGPLSPVLFRGVKMAHRTQDSLNRLARALAANPSVRIKLIMASWDRRSVEENLDHSLKRVELVKAYLVMKGVAGSRLETEAKHPDEKDMPEDMKLEVEILAE